MRASAVPARLSRWVFVGGVAGVAVVASCGLVLLGRSGTLIRPTKLARVAYIGNLAFDLPELGEALSEGLRDLGWVEGQK